MVDKKEQEMKEEINTHLRKKDFYDILGLAKTATETQIKKAYRSLALRFHPDKNQFEGAKEVFKKVSNAYATLSDGDKRRHYDQFGPQEDRPRPQYRRAGAHGEDYEFEQFDDIFQAFFGGMPMHNRRGNQNFRAQHFNNNQGHAHAQPQGFNFYYIFVIFFVLYTILPLFQSSPNYSTSPTYEHRIRRNTPRLNVEYYVNQKFMEQAKNPEYRRKAQMEMDKQFLNQLQQKCEYVKSQKRNLQIYAYQHREGPQRQGYLSRAKNIDLTSCRMLHQISLNHEDYVRELTYMRY